MLAAIEHFRVSFSPFFPFAKRLENQCLSSTIALPVRMDGSRNLFQEGLKGSNLTILERLHSPDVNTTNHLFYDLINKCEK